MRQVFNDVRGWLENGIWMENMRVGINVSPRQFRDKHFVEDVKTLLQETRVPAKVIEFEITEGIVIHNVAETIETMQRSIDFAKNLDPDIAIFNITTPYPGTQMFEWAKARGYLRTFDWGEYDLGR